MITVVQSIEKAALQAPVLFSYDLKISYILSEQTICIGHAGYLAFYLDSIDSYTMSQRATVMRRTLDPEVDKSNIEKIDSFHQITKQYNSLKHPNTLIIKTYKNIEHLMKEIYIEWRAKQEIELIKLGYNQLKSLSDGNALGYCFFKEDYNSYNKSKNDKVDTESFIKLIFPDEDTSDHILFFNDVFYQEVIIKDKLFLSPFDEAASDTSVSYIYNILELPNMHIYSAIELKAIRESLKEPLSDFRKLVDEWCVHCKNNEDKTASLRFFKDNIALVASSINDIMLHHPIMKHHYNFQRGYRSYVLMGETTKELLLNYFKHFEYIDESKYAEIKERYIAEDIWDRRMPIVFSSVNNVLTFPPVDNQEESNLQDQVLSIRKFISLD